MKKQFIFLLIGCLAITACQSNQETEQEPILKEKMVEKPTVHHSNPTIEKFEHEYVYYGKELKDRVLSQDSFDKIKPMVNLCPPEPEIKDSAFDSREDLWLLKKKFNNGHILELIGHAFSGCLYEVTVTKANGKVINYPLREYDLRFSMGEGSLTWMNDSFIVIHGRCGAPCWKVEVLALESPYKINSYWYPIYEDSLSSTIAWLDMTEKGVEIRAENLNTKKSIKYNVPIAHEDYTSRITCIKRSWITDDFLFIRYDSSENVTAFHTFDLTALK